MAISLGIYPIFRHTHLHPFTMDVSCFGRGLVGSTVPTLSATEIRQASAGSVGDRPHFCHFFWWFWTATIYIDVCLCCIVSSQFVHLWADWRMKGEQSRQTTSNGYLEVCVKCSSSLHIWGRNSHYFGKTVTLESVPRCHLQRHWSNLL